MPSFVKIIIIIMYVVSVIPVSKARENNINNLPKNNLSSVYKTDNSGTFNFSNIMNFIIANHPT